MATTIVSNSTAATFGNSPQKTGEPLDHAKLYSGKALEFDGVADYLDTGYSALDNSLSGQDLTLSCWLKEGSTHNDYAVIWGTSDYNANNGFCIKNNSSNRICIHAAQDTDAVTANYTIASGEWHFVVGTWTESDKKVRLYVDGALVETSSAASASIDFNQSWTIAERFVMGARFTSAPQH